MHEAKAINLIQKKHTFVPTSVETLILDDEVWANSYKQVDCRMGGKGPSRARDMGVRDRGTLVLFDKYGYYMHGKQKDI